VTRPPYNATGNGSTDDRAAIQACINAAASQGKGVYFPAGTYHMIASGGVGLTIPSNVTLRGVGDTSVVQLYDAGTDARHVLANFQNKSNVTVKNLKLTGTQTNKEASVQNCWCSGATNITFDHVTWGGCEYAIRTTTNASWANGINVLDCTTLTSVLNPFYLSYCNAFYLDGGTYEANRVDCVPTRWPHHFYVSGYTSNLTVKNATFTGGQHAMMTIDGPQLSDVLFQNIVIEDMYQGICFYFEGTNIVFDGLIASTARMDPSNPEWFRFADGARNITIKNFNITGDPNRNDFLCRVNGPSGSNCLFKNGIMTSCYTSGTNPPGTVVGSQQGTAPEYDNVVINTPPAIST